MKWHLSLSLPGTAYRNTQVQAVSGTMIPMSQLQPTGFHWSMQLRQYQPTGLHWQEQPKWRLAVGPTATVVLGQTLTTSSSGVADAGSAHSLVRRITNLGEPV